MATMTQAELAIDILENLGVKAAGQSASAEDTTKVSSAITAVYSELVRDRVAQWPVDAIPEWAQLPLRDLVSFELKSVFGITGEALGRLASDYQRALQRIYRHTSGRADPRVRQKATYY